MKGECDLCPSLGPGFPAGDLPCGGEKLAASPGRTCLSAGVWELLQHPWGLVTEAQRPRLSPPLGPEQRQSSNPRFLLLGAPEDNCGGKGQLGVAGRGLL